MRLELLAFFAGPPETGEERLAALFQANDLSTSRKNAHRLANEFAYRRLGGEPARELLEEYNLVIGLESGNQPGRPFLTEFQELDHLLQSFPDAVLIFNDIDEGQWIRRMQSRDGGVAADLQASWLNIPKGDLPAVWSAQYKEQRQRVVAAKENGATAVFLAADGSFSSWRDCLSPWFDLPTIPARGNATVAYTREVRKGRDVLDVLPASALNLTSMLARHCLGNLQPDATGSAALSAFYAEWDGAKKVTRQDGTRIPIRFGLLGGRLSCLARPGVSKIARVEGVINDAISSGVARPLRMDMEDCRLYGTGQENITAKPVITYCRRAGARNVVLWPLPHYHSIVEPNFLGGSPDDDVPFQDKLDILFWRGAISGHCSDEAGGIFSNPVWSVANRLVTQPNRDDLWALFETCTRVSVLRQHNATCGVDLRFVSGPEFKFFSKHPRTARYCGEGTNRRGMLRYRYILSMRGYDTGSNFVSAANSNSVVLKEEDGWELFYSPLFRPWESYIPLAAGLHDLEEKLDWARRNPARCQEISSTAQAACNYLSLPDYRGLLLRTIAKGL